MALRTRQSRRVRQAWADQSAVSASDDMDGVETPVAQAVSAPEAVVFVPSTTSAVAPPPPPIVPAAIPGFVPAVMPKAYYGPPEEQPPVDAALVTHDTYAINRMKEGEHRTFDPKAKYLKYRRLLVDWIFEAAENFSMSNVTSHVAAGYMDRVLQSVTVAKNRLQLIAACCFLLAAKYEEAEENIPSAADMSAFCNNAYPASLINEFEVLILERLGWKCTVITPLSYLGQFAAEALVFTNDTIGGRPLVPKVPRYVVKYTNFFTDMCQQDYSFARYPPSLLAAAIVVASRRALNITPLWNPALASVLRYPLKEIQAPLEHVWQCYATKYPEQLADGGVVPVTPAETSVQDVARATPARMHNPEADVPMLSPEAVGQPATACVGTPVTPDTITTAAVSVPLH